MTKSNRSSGMVITSVIMGLLALVMFIIAYSKGNGTHLLGLQRAWTMTLQILPLLIAAFIIAGMVQVLVPQEMLAKWVGAESGIKGILIGTVAGGLSPGGPYVSLPLAAALLNSGASVGTMVAYLTGWSLWAIGRLPMEVGILGWKFTLIRFISTFTFPVIAGLIARYFFSGIRIGSL